MRRGLARMAVSAALIAALLTGCAGAGKDDGGQSGGRQTVPLTIWGAENDQAILREFADSFAEHYAEYADFDIQIGVESESTAKDTVLTDVEAAADVYSFASDQLSDLVNAGALQPLDPMEEVFQKYVGKSVEDIKKANTEGSVESAMMDGTLYAFPRTADNGYFLYYDASVISEEDAKSWDTLLAAAQRAGKKVGMTLASGWYDASFFYSAGFTTSLNPDGTTSMDWNKTADYTGVQVAEGMARIAGDPAFMAVADGDMANQLASGQLCAAVSGVWDADVAQKVFGDGYSAAILPTFTVAGEQVQQLAVVGCKLVAVNAYSEYVGWAVLFADWMTNEEAQMKSFEQNSTGPSNIKVMNTDIVQQNVAIATLGEQSNYGVIQSVGQNYWDPAKTFGEMVAKGVLKEGDTAGIQAALDTLVEGVTAPIQ